MKSENLCKILIASIVANSVLVIAICSLLVYHRNGYTDGHSGNSHQLCLEHFGGCMVCDYLGNIKTNDTLYSRIHTVNGRKTCCMDNPAYLPELVRQIIKTEEQNKSDETSPVDMNKNLEWWRSRPNSIHMNLDIEQLKENKFVWRTDNDALGLAFNNSVSINMETNSIVVPGPQRARYFIYVAFTFDFGDLDTVPIFYHNVTMSHPLLPKTIATLLMSKYGGSSESDRKYTSFLCGNFEIQGDFHIKTEVSNYEYVSRSKYASYFGMFRL